jgi:hypothetical protein
MPSQRLNRGSRLSPSPPARTPPGHGTTTINTDNLDWLLQAFDELLMFYQGVAARRNAVMTWIS